MNKIASFFSNPWTLFALAVFCFSICAYVPLTTMFVIWGLGLLVAAVVRFIVEHEKQENARRGY